MHEIPKFNPSSTYVIDESEIEQLDELSLTSMVTALVEVAPESSLEPASDVPVSLTTGDTAINEILAASSPGQQAERSLVSAEPEVSGDLLPAEVLFPDLKSERQR
jgi:hypothetical protein